MDSWERFNETSLPDKEAFYSSSSMEVITDVDYRHAKRVFKSLNNKYLGDYHICIFRVIHYCLHVYLKILEACALKYMS